MRWQWAVALNSCLSDRMSRSYIALHLPSTPTASQVMMADIANGIAENKNLRVCAAWCKWVDGMVHVAYAYGTLFQWSFLGAHGWIYTISSGDDAPLSTMASRVLFCVRWANSVGINGRRVGGTLRLAYNGNGTGLAGVFGERPDWPVSDHTGRQTWNLHLHERQDRPHWDREWWVHGEGGGREIWVLRA